MYPLIFIHVVTWIKKDVRGAWGKEQCVCIVDNQIKLSICSFKSNLFGLKDLLLMKSSGRLQNDGDTCCHFLPPMDSVRLKRNSFTCEKHHSLSFKCPALGAWVSLELRLLISCLWEREISQGVSHGPSVITRVLVSGRSWKSENREMAAGLFGSTLLALRKGREPGARKYTSPLEAGKGSPRVSRKMQLCWHLDFSPVRPILDF